MEAVESQRSEETGRGPFEKYGWQWESGDQDASTSYFIFVMGVILS